MWRREGEGKKSRCELGKGVSWVVWTTRDGGNGDSERGHDECFERQKVEYGGWGEWEEGWKDGSVVEERRVMI